MRDQEFPGNSPPHDQHLNSAKSRLGVFRKPSWLRAWLIALLLLSSPGSNTRADVTLSLPSLSGTPQQACSYSIAPGEAQLAPDDLRVPFLRCSEHCMQSTHSSTRQQNDRASQRGNGKHEVGRHEELSSHMSDMKHDSCRENVPGTMTMSCTACSGTTMPGMRHTYYLSSCNARVPATVSMSCIVCSGATMPGMRHDYYSFFLRLQPCWLHLSS